MSGGSRGVSAARLLRRAWFALRALVRGGRADQDIDDEIAYHLEREADLHRQRGMSAEAAAREARRAFGGTLRYREECRDVRNVSLLEDAHGDARFALRLMRRHPAFAANVIGITALGIAASVT